MTRQSLALNGDMLQPVAHYGPVPVPSENTIDRSVAARRSGAQLSNGKTIHIHDLTAEV